MVIGHQPHERALRAHLPAVSLFVGPDSVGKTTLAFQLVRAHDADLMRFQHLTVETARTCSEAAMMAPPRDLRVIMLDLDGASESSLTVLLKALEEAPPTTKFILIASELPMNTIVSRCSVFSFALLSEDDVAEILERKKFAPAEARKLAALSGGQIQTALKFADNLDAKVTVLSALRAIRERDSKALDGLAIKWADPHTELLSQLCREALTRRWRVFQAAEVEGMSGKLAMSILIALRANVRPRLVVRSSLMSVMKEAA